MQRLLLMAALLASSLSLLGQARHRVQLKDFRSRFVGQRIVINPDFSNMRLSALAGWQFVKEEKGLYRIQYSQEVPASFAGRAGTIIAVQAPQRVGGAPADQADETYVQYAQAIVKLNSGELLSTTLFNAFLGREPGSQPGDAFALASTRERHKREAVELARELTGKSLYLTRLTRLFGMRLKTTDAQAIAAGIGYSDAEITDFPILTPLPVLQTLYNAKRDFNLVQLQLPDGRKALYVLGCVANSPSPRKYDCATTAMPSFLTNREVEAIRKGNVFAGMSEPAVYMAMGRPQHTGKSSVGQEEELVYPSKHVYLDGSHKVAKVQKQN